MRKANEKTCSCMTVGEEKCWGFVHAKDVMNQKIKALGNNVVRRIGMDDFGDLGFMYFENLGNRRLHVRVDHTSEWIYYQVKTWYLDTFLTYQITDDGKLTLSNLSIEEDGVHVPAKDFKKLCTCVYLHLCSEVALLDREHYQAKDAGRINHASDDEKPLAFGHDFFDRSDAISVRAIAVSRAKTVHGTRRHCKHIVKQPGYWAHRGKDKHLTFVHGSSRRERPDAIDLGDPNYKL